jgi:hypothetical protein
MDNRSLSVNIAEEAKLQFARVAVTIAGPISARSISQRSKMQFSNIRAFLAGENLDRRLICAGEQRIDVVR